MEDRLQRSSMEIIFANKVKPAGQTPLKSLSIALVRCNTFMANVVGEDVRSLVLSCFPVTGTATFPENLVPFDYLPL